MGRSRCCDLNGFKRGPWTPEEDQKLIAYVQQHGHGSWRSLPEKAGLKRCGKSCRLRWTNYLRPDIKRGKFSLPEEQTIMRLHALLGNRWSAIAAHLPKRTDNDIKNSWNTHIKKRLARIGVDPLTHRPKAAAVGSAHSDPIKTSNLWHMAQWESARLEAEARLVKESKARQNEPAAGGSSRSFSASAKLLNRMATTRTRPPCLDILKAWQNVCFKFSYDSSKNGIADIVNFGDGKYLQSATSTLHFSENTQAVTTIASFENLSKNLGMQSEINEGMFNKRSRDMTFDAGATGEAWITGTSNAETESSIEGFSNILFDNTQNLTDASTSVNNGIGSEEKNNAWNELINIVDCQPPNSPSPLYSPLLI